MSAKPTPPKNWKDAIGPCEIDVGHFARLVWKAEENGDFEQWLSDALGKGEIERAPHNRIKLPIAK